MKRVIALLLLLATAFSLVSCTGMRREPAAYKAAIERIYGELFEVVLYEDIMDRQALGGSFGINGVVIDTVLVIRYEGEVSGYVFYFKASNNATDAVQKIRRALIMSPLEDTCVVKRRGTVVFMGDKNLWRCIKWV